jgi:hypothetical protein
LIYKVIVSPADGGEVESAYYPKREMMDRIDSLLRMKPDASVTIARVAGMPMVNVTWADKTSEILPMDSVAPAMMTGKLPATVDMT